LQKKKGEKSKNLRKRTTDVLSVADQGPICEILVSADVVSDNSQKKHKSQESENLLGKNLI
jgi:ssRNA-specific RNase YbeY (16S rRNA maturation enzyme)